MMVFCMYFLGSCLILASWDEEDGELLSFIGFMIMAATFFRDVL